VHLVGQSAGGHLTALALLAQAARVAADEDAGGSAAAEGGAAAGAADGAANGACALPQHQQRAHQQKPPLPPPLGASPPWDPRRLRAYAAVSGTYDLEALVDHLHGRGLYRPLFLDIMAGPDGATGAAALRALSPTAAAAALAPAAAAALPPALLLHGGADRTVPAAHAAAFAAALRAAGAAARLVVYPGKTHTQPIVEDPMGGGRDELMDEILSLVRGRSCTTRQFAMCPAALIAAASYVSPF
jgi:acetyl esterase/lipase